MFSFLLGKISKSRIGMSYGKSAFHFLTISQFFNCFCNFPKISQYLTFPVATHKGQHLATSLPILVTIWYFYCEHPSEYEVEPHCGFDLHFPEDWCVECFLTCLLATCVLWRQIYPLPLPIFNWVIFLLLNCKSSLHWLGTSPIYDKQIFSLILWIVFCKVLWNKKVLILWGRVYLF